VNKHSPPRPDDEESSEVAEVADDTAGAPGGSETSGERAAVFRGVTQLVLDAKGRLAIPARHRDALAGNGNGHLVLTADPSRCLLLYPLAAWEPIQARLMALSSFDEKIRGLQRLIVGHADDVEIDAAGRILVPPALRRYANLDKHVVLVGQGRKFELWDEAQWQNATAQAITFPADGLPPELSGFTL
jgi:MraZ protein